MIVSGTWASQPKRYSIMAPSAPTTRVANVQTLVWDLRLFVILQTFLLLLNIFSKPRLLCTPHHKTTSMHLEFKNFDSILQKNFVISDKSGKSAPPSLCLGRPMAFGNAYVRHFTKFLDFFKRNVGNPVYNYWNHYSAFNDWYL